jgi:hypothetical protein
MMWESGLQGSAVTGGTELDIDERVVAQIVREAMRKVKG